MVPGIPNVVNTQHFSWVFATWLFTTLGILDVGYLSLSHGLQTETFSRNICYWLHLNALSRGAGSQDPRNSIIGLSVLL